MAQPTPATRPPPPGGIRPQPGEGPPPSGGLKEEHAAFGWREVDCFLRPQAILCDELGAGYGQLLLCLTSLYRTWGADGFFVEPGRGHFEFLRSPFREMTGIELHPTFLEERGSIAEVLRDEVLPGGGAAIVPANIRELPHFRGFMKQDLRHYFLVRGFDHASRSFDVYDYLHVQHDNQSLAYAPCRLPAGLLASLAADYWDRFVGAQPPGPEGDAPYWVLQVRAAAGWEPMSEPELCALALSGCQRVLALGDHAPHALQPLDERFLSRLRAAQAAGDATELGRAAHVYYAAANHSHVYLKVACRSLSALGREAAARRLASELASWDESAGKLRMQLILRCKLRRAPDPAVWDEFSAKLSSLSERLRGAALAECGGS